MYQSPIDVIYKDIQMQVKEQADKQIYEAVQQCGISVDKDELIKALQYDRGQYEKGYADALSVIEKIKAEIDEQYDRVHPYNIYCAEGLEMAEEIIDKYKGEKNE